MKFKKEINKSKSNHEEARNVEKVNTINFINESFSSDFDEEYKEKEFMPWECLPFASKRSKNGKKLDKKQNVKTKENKKKSQIKISKNEKKEVQENCFSSEIVGNLTYTEKKEFKKTNKHNVPTITNSSFGFDLQGGILENQLTFITNVNPNGNAAKKGLKNGDILVSIQNKIVIGINRNEIEKLLNKYTVEDEIEIVICRLKNPAYILNLYNMYSDLTYDNYRNLTKQFHSLNDQLYSELISFQKLLPNDFKKSSSLVSHSILLSSNQESNQIRKNEKLPRKFEEKKLIMNVNCGSNDKANGTDDLKTVDHSKHQNINSDSQLKDFSDGISLPKSYSNPGDFSVVLLDKICGKSHIGSAGNHLSANMDSSKLNDFILISVSQKTPQVYHPQIRQNVKHNNMKPINFYSVKSTPSSINDFTGSILNAERESNLIKKQTKLCELKQSETDLIDSFSKSVNNSIDKQNGTIENDNYLKRINDTKKINATTNYNHMDQKNSKNYQNRLTIGQKESSEPNLKIIRKTQNKLFLISNLSQNKRKTNENESSSKRKKFNHSNNFKWQNEFRNNYEPKNEELDDTNHIEIPIIIPLVTTNFDCDEKMISIKSPLITLDSKNSKVRSMIKKDKFIFPNITSTFSPFSINKHSNIANDGNIDLKDLEQNNKIVTLSKFIKKNNIPYQLNCNDSFVSIKSNLIDDFESSYTKLISFSNPMMKLVEKVIPKMLNINYLSSTQNQNENLTENADCPDNSDYSRNKYHLYSQNKTYNISLFDVNHFENNKILSKLGKQNSLRETNIENKEVFEEKSKIRSENKCFYSLTKSDKRQVGIEKIGHDSNQIALDSAKFKINELLYKNDEESHANEKSIQQIISKKRAQNLARTQTEAEFKVIDSKDSYESISDSECLLRKNNSKSTNKSKSLTNLRDKDEIDYLEKWCSHNKIFPKETDKILNTEKHDLIFDWNQNAREDLIIRNDDFACNSIDFSIDMDSSLSDQSNEKIDSAKSSTKNNDEIPKIINDFENNLTSSSILSNTLNDSDGTKKNFGKLSIKTKNQINNKNGLSNTPSSSLRTSLVFDDGYDSTVSYRNTTESFSSMEDTELNKSHINLSDKKNTKLNTKNLNQTSISENIEYKDIDSLFNSCWEDFVCEKDAEIWMNKSNFDQSFYSFGNRKKNSIQIENYLIQDCFRVINNIIKQIELLQAQDYTSCIEKCQDIILIDENYSERINFEKCWKTYKIPTTSLIYEKNNENSKKENDHLVDYILNPKNKLKEISIDPKLFNSVNIYLGKECIENYQKVPEIYSELNKNNKHKDKDLLFTTGIDQKKIIQSIKLANEIKDQNKSIAKEKKAKKFKFLREFKKEDIDIYLIPPFYNDNYTIDFDEKNQNIEKQPNRLFKKSNNCYFENLCSQFKSSTSKIKFLSHDYNVIGFKNKKSTFIYSNNSRKQIQFNNNYPQKDVKALNFILEKNEFRKLNDMLAFYIEKLKILEVQNRTIKIRMEILRNNEKGQTVQIQEMYLVEIEKAKKVVDDIKLKVSQNEANIMKSKDDLQLFKIKSTEIESIASNNKCKIKQLQNNLLNCEKEISFMTRKLNDLKKERSDLKQNYALLVKEITSTSNYLEQEVSKRIDLEYKKHTLEQEIKHLETNRYQQLNDLQKTIFNKNFFDSYYYHKNYLVNNLQKMRDDYQQHYLQEASMLEECYNSKIVKSIRNFEKISSKNKLPNQQLILLKDEICHSKEKIIRLKYDNILLQNRIKDLEDQLDRENHQSLILMRKKEEEISRLKNNICETNKDYEKFICYKNELEREINMFRNLSDDNGIFKE